MIATALVFAATIFGCDDASIDPQPVDAAHAQLLVEHAVALRPHPAGRGRWYSCCTSARTHAFDLLVGQTPGPGSMFRFVDLASGPDSAISRHSRTASTHAFEVLGIVEEVQVDRRLVVWVGRAQPDAALRLRGRRNDGASVNAGFG